MDEHLDREALFLGQARVLDGIAVGAPLSESLTLLLQVVESMSPDMLGSILLLDPDGIHLRHGAAPSLPDEYVQAIDGVAIGAMAGSCGTAAFRREPVIVEDIDADPLWSDYRELAGRFGLRACWSTPIMGEADQVLGTFAMYYRTPSRPPRSHRELVERLSHLAAVAIARQRDGASLADSHAVFQQLLEGGHAARLSADDARHTGEDRHRVQRNALIALTGDSNLYEVDVDTALRHIAEAAARTLDVARVSIWRYSPDRSGIRCLVQYDLATDSHSLRLELLAAEHPVYFQALAAGGLVSADDARRDPRTAEFADSYLLPAGITAMLDAPVHVRGIVDGVLCHEHIGAARQWTPDEKTFAVAAANLVSLALEAAERRKAQDELLEAQSRLQRAVEAGQIGLWDWDIRENTVRYSAQWKRQIGYEDHEIGNDFEEWRSRVHPDDLERVLEELRAYLAGESTLYEMDFRFRHRSGAFRHIMARGSKSLGADRTPIRMVGTHVDITERAELQAQFQQAQKMESVGRLAGGIAHDFNNLLTVINGTVELVMADVREGDPLRDDLRQIQQAGARAATLTQQLLAFSRRQILRPVVLNLSTVINGMREMLRRLIGEDIHLIVSAPDDLGAVRADSGQIEQVVMNLAVNARDAMANGGRLSIELRNVDLDAAYAATHPAVKPGPHVMLALSDSGAGMDEATRERIFEPFFTTKGPARGTGLGLSTVYGIVEQSTGSIGVYSEPGVGTTFTIHFPRVEAPVVAARVLRSTETARGAETILIVEDEEGVRTLATRILQSAGYAIIVASSGTEALQLLEHHHGPVNLLLTDVVLPHMSGRDLAHRLGAVRPGVKVLYTSGYTDDAILRHGVLDAETNFIAKPYSRAELTRKVRDVLDA